MDSNSLEFLKKFKPMQQSTGLKSSDFKFRLRFTAEGTMLATVDADGKKPVRPRAADYGGALRTALSLLGSSVTSSFSWLPTGQSKTIAGEINLDNNPALLTALIRCPNLVDDKGESIKVSPDEASLRLSISTTDGESDPAADGDKPGAAVATPRISAILNDGGEVADFDLVSDSFIHLGHTIYPVRHIGDNFRQIGALLEPFDFASIETYLAIFLTYFENIDIDAEGYKIVYKTEPQETVPTIVIDKIDVDRALYLKLTSTMLNEDEQFIEVLPSAYSVKLGGNSIVVRPLSHHNTAKDVDDLVTYIKSLAPRRSDKAEIYSNDNLIIIPEATASTFLLEGLPRLLHTYRVVGIEKLKDYKLRPVTPRLNMRFSSGINFLEGNADVDIDGQKFTLKDLIDQYNRQKFVTLRDGSRAIIDGTFVRRIERIFNSRDKDGNFKISFFDLPEVEQLLDDDMRAAPALKRPREFYAGFNKLSKSKVDTSGVNAQLRPYQVDGVKWLRYLYDNNMGGCLADDMGLGKTLQVITLLTTIYPKQKQPTLIVMPRSLLFNWESELKRFAPQLDVFTYYGQGRDLTEALSHQVVLTTYALVRNDIEELSKASLHMVVLDESQTIKNVAAMQTRSVYLLRADKRLALSGTPLENNLSELYSLFRFLNPTMFGTLEAFNRQYIQPIQQDDREAVEALRRRIFPFMLRRLKRDVLKDLPERIDQTIYVDMEPELARFYEQRRQYYAERVDNTIATEGLAKSHFVMFQALSELRRIASVPESLTDGAISSPKIEALFEQIESAVTNGHKVVVFFNFIAGLELLAERLNASGIITETMTGATSDRSGVIRRFQTDPNCRALIMTLKTGGVGLNLTAADMVFIAEPWWNRAAEEQGINRLHRIGQRSTVFTFSFITHGTIEEKIRELQQRKADLFDDVISSDESTAKRLTEDDIKFILS